MEDQAAITWTYWSSLAFVKDYIPLCDTTGSTPHHLSNTLYHYCRSRGVNKVVTTVSNQTNLGQCTKLVLLFSTCQS